MRIQRPLASSLRGFDDRAGGVLAVVRLGRHGGGRALAAMRAAGAGVSGLHAAQGSGRPAARVSDKLATHLLRHAAVCLVACGAMAAFAQDGDPLKSQACAHALESLQAARASGPGGTRVEQLRAAAASACLGQAPVPRRPSRVARPPVAVPPPLVEPPARAAAPAAVALPAPPVVIDRPATPLVCDAGGCWADTGTHLRQIGPGLAGPQGPCTSQGGLVYCP